jgi:hypothetical protein
MTCGRGGRLLFRWGAGGVTALRLWLFVGISLFAHLLVFYLVRSVDPPVERWTPRTTGITLLMEGDELTQSVLRQLEDRTFQLFPGSETLPASVGFDRYAPSFRPSFAEHEIALRPLFSHQQGWELARSAEFLDIPLLGLPPLPKAREPDPGEPEASRTAYLNLGPGLIWRKFEVDRERLADWFRSGQPLYFRVYAGVSPRGVVEVMSVAEEFEGKISPGELELVRQSLRFEPARKWAWDWIEIQR